MQIKQLEESIGLPLFEQMGKKIYLTEAGREMFHVQPQHRAAAGRDGGGAYEMKGWSTAS